MLRCAGDAANMSSKRLGSSEGEPAAPYGEAPAPAAERIELRWAGDAANIASKRFGSAGPTSGEEATYEVFP